MYNFFSVKLTTQTHTHAHTCTPFSRQLSLPLFGPDSTHLHHHHHHQNAPLIMMIMMMMIIFVTPPLPPATLLFKTKKQKEDDTPQQQQLKHPTRVPVTHRQFLRWLALVQTFILFCLTHFFLPRLFLLHPRRCVRVAFCSKRLFFRVPFVKKPASQLAPPPPP